MSDIQHVKKKLLNIRIDPELKKRAKKLAREDGRSLSNWVTKLIVSKVENAEKQKKARQTRRPFPVACVNQIGR